MPSEREVEAAAKALLAGGNQGDPEFVMEDAQVALAAAEKVRKSSASCTDSKDARTEEVHTCHAKCPCQTGGEPMSDFVEARTEPETGQRMVNRFRELEAAIRADEPGEAVGLLKARIKYEQERVKYEQGRIAELEARLGDVTADRADIYDRAQETTGQLRYEIAKLEARLNHPHDQQVADLISSLARDGRKGKVPDSGNLEYAEQMAALLRDRANPSTDSEEHNAE